MDETSKMRVVRKARGDFDRYLLGYGIDIGCGQDPLQVPNGTVDPWDMPQGDAVLLEGVPNERYDFVFSSHCAEHLWDLSKGLHRWLDVIKPGGFLYFVVPDFDLYEQGIWPSRFNGDHKRAFSMWRASDPPVINMLDIAKELQLRSRLRELRLEDYGYDYSLRGVDQTMGAAVAQICYIAQRL